MAKKITTPEKVQDKRLELQEKGKELALLIDEYCSASPEKNASLKNLEQVIKFALYSVKK